MIITHKPSKTVKFEQLACGEVFKNKHSGICMKIEACYDINTVYLSDGSIYSTDDDELVEIVKCELVLDC